MEAQSKTYDEIMTDMMIERVRHMPGVVDDGSDGIAVIVSLALRDHPRYTAQDIAEIVIEAQDDAAVERGTVMTRTDQDQAIESEQERMIRLADECLAMTRAINLTLRERLLDRLAIECQAERQAEFEERKDV